MQSLDIQGFSYEERHGLLPTLTSAFADCGGWILDRKTLSPSTIEFRIEIQLRAVVDLYSSIIASGLELTRSGHLGLTHLCTCRKNLSSPCRPRPDRHHPHRDQLPRRRNPPVRLRQTASPAMTLLAASLLRWESS